MSVAFKFHLFYVLVKICVVFVVELNVKVIPVKYGWELTVTRYNFSFDGIIGEQKKFSK